MRAAGVDPASVGVGAHGSGKRPTRLAVTVLRRYRKASLTILRPTFSGNKIAAGGGPGSRQQTLISVKPFRKKGG
jgi:hypothetical protein